MAVEQTDIIDLIGIDQETDEVVLTITDSLPWEGREDDHLFLLQEKINTYVGFIESGDILAEFPEAEGREPVITIVGKYALPDAALDFVRQAESIVAARGIKFCHELVQLH
ncbi:DUF6572 domain-containing protein [Aestuariispira insulae]|uniref:Uncharacterized protein n=1 Tax=Aestuariispira insulae TaxID=1461337 RepID=A0A3D9HWQ2_9PROT|nr:DUF6572 domain-containing protein [Aestuariispira insulae]RED53811.1 hypothetical protein DFP90_101610 [Aestuariispira insulae]